MESRTLSLSCYLLMGSGSVLLPHLFDENSNMSPLSMILNPLLITLPCHIIAGLKGRLRSVGYPCSMISQLLGFRRRAPDCCMWRSPPAPHKAGYESCDQKRSPSPSSPSSNSVLVSSLRPMLRIGAKLGWFVIVDTRPTQADISRKIVSS